MNYIAFWEFKPEDLDKIIEKYKYAMAEREKGTGKFPKFLFPSHSIGGEYKGFTIYENPTPEQLMNLVLYFSPEEKMKFAPIFESAKYIERYMAIKK
jgi:hypothetical protein